ncbi:MAG: S1 RNA-binding domain-containing protein [bacterium]|nr:S1 RNA-binding domain-containing protein [bacterium]
MAQAKTMAELLANKQKKIISPKKDSQVSGVIVAKTDKSLMVDIGAKTEGLIVGKEYDVAKDYIKSLEVGQKIDVVVTSVEANKGQILLSLRQAANKQKWDFFYDALKENKIIEVKGVETNKGGLIVVVNGIRGFVPSSQFGKDYLGQLNKLRGETIKVKTIEVDHEKNRLIFSEKYVSEEKELAQKNAAMKAVQPGAIYEGVVSGLMPFGLFVTAEVPVNDKGEVGLVEGLVHISEISWEKVTHPGNYHKLGDRIKVKVLEVDPANEKLNLSIKQLSDDPWLTIDQRYPIGSVVSGTVSRVEQFGVFVNVETGVDGLIHSSKLDGEQKLAKGDKVSVNVESIDKENKRMSLTLISNELPIDYK